MLSMHYMMKVTKPNSLLAMILTQLVLLLLLNLKTTESVNNTIALHGYRFHESCGGIPIPYPFGIGSKCSLSQEFNVTCDMFNGRFTPFLGSSNDFEILNISLFGQARVASKVPFRCYNSTTKVEEDPFFMRSFPSTSFQINTEKNKLTVIGCNTFGYLSINTAALDLIQSTTNALGCYSGCDNLSETLNNNGSCSGIGCCQRDIPNKTSDFQLFFDEMHSDSEVYTFSPCSYAMVVEEAEFNFNTTYITTEKLKDIAQPMVIDWAIGNTACDTAQKNKSSYACKSDHSVCLNSTSGPGYICNCSYGYEGNPYLEGGCQDIDECANQNACTKPRKCHNFQGGYRCSCPFGHTYHNNSRKCDLNVSLVVIGTAVGIVALLFLGVGIYVVLERRGLSKVKEKYFQQYGGWIMLEKIKSNQGFSFTIFTKQQVEQATNNFDSANILGHGGHGTVYKGTIRDQTVAIKKCKIINESKKKEFGKEMFILSQINHKNIVKILGCCLEVEVPMLIYEFISNGTLYHYIHHKNQASHISLATRLRIAHESAEALAYLHTSASPPIFHGDVKSANILLDQNYIAKLSDFGASILAPTDQAQFVTLVQGTWGYLDPEYMQSCKLTDKSDVYSFGVVLLELLTSKAVIDFHGLEEDKSLSSRFLSAMKDNTMEELLDKEIKHEDDMELITAVPELAKECLSTKGGDRPMMKEVVDEVHRIRKLKHHLREQEYNIQETETLFNERPLHEIEIELAGYSLNIDKEAEESIAVGR